MHTDLSFTKFGKILAILYIYIFFSPRIFFYLEKLGGSANSVIISLKCY